MERVVGIEPTFPAWKAGVLPIYDTRIFDKQPILIETSLRTELYLNSKLLFSQQLFST